ncbi:MAG: UDP-3-O-[3-hydroxymyristoyl] glucosamine N-acyltransferase [Planctomycetota bacterium]|jgi:UDP-3-O-[3-hydroxymyristoyl] glucosamine N-acyltransferase
MSSRSLTELAALCDAKLEGDASARITGPAALYEASSSEISFLAHRRYREQLVSTHAAAVIVETDDDLPELARRVDGGGPAILRCENPGRAFSRIILEFAPADVQPEAGVHESAVVDPSAEIDASASIGPLCTVGAGTVIAEKAVLDAGVHIGSDVQIGPSTRLHSGVVVYAHVRIGERCLIHSGTVIGADGFGFEPTPAGWEKTPQCGSVRIDNDVEIGANVTIDRARFGETSIGAGVKIDNLVHLAHNVRVEANAMLIAQSGVAGSSKIGKWALLAGQAGVSGHLDIGDGARVGGGSAAFKDIPAGQDVFGLPAGPKEEQLTMLARQRRLGRLQGRVRELEKRLAQLEQEMKSE